MPKSDFNLLIQEAKELFDREEVAPFPPTPPTEQREYIRGICELLARYQQTRGPQGSSPEMELTVELAADNMVKIGLAKDFDTAYNYLYPKPPKQKV